MALALLNPWQPITTTSGATTAHSTCTPLNATAGALSHQAGHAGSASALMGTFQFSLGALSGVLVGMLTDGTPRGMAALMFFGMTGAVIADRFRPRPKAVAI